MSKPASEAIEVKAPPKEIETSQIAGIEVMDLEDAVKVLWKQNIYAESGMGCTGPIIRVSDANLAKAEEESKRLADDRKTLTIRKQETESSLIEAKTMLSSLSELSFDTWKEAKKVCTDSADEVQQVVTHIQQVQNRQKDTLE